MVTANLLPEIWTKHTYEIVNKFEYETTYRPYQT